MPIRVVTLTERPELASIVREHEIKSFPKFLLQNPAAWEHAWQHMTREFSDFQLFLFDERDQLLLISNSVPFFWKGTADDLPGWQELLYRSVRELEAGVVPNALCGVQAMATEAGRGRAITDELAAALHETLNAHHLSYRLSPIRATKKHLYPLIPMQQYRQWRTKDGRCFDPWLRAQERRGARFLKIVEASTVITGTVAQWESWIDMELPASGAYVFADGQSPLHIDKDTDHGRYEDAHLWYVM